MKVDDGKNYAEREDDDEREIQWIRNVDHLLPKSAETRWHKQRGQNDAKEK